MANPWDQLPKESSRAFASFIVYRDLGMNRSCTEAAKKTKKSQSSVVELSKNHKWQERVRAWDAHIDGQTQKEQIEAVRLMKQRQIALALKAQKAAEKGLKKFIAQFTADKNGKVSPYATKPDGLSKLLDTGCRLERLNRDVPEQSLEVTKGDNLDKLSLEELEAYRDLAAKVDGGK